MKKNEKAQLQLGLRFIIMIVIVLIAIVGLSVMAGQQFKFFKAIAGAEECEGAEDAVEVETTFTLEAGYNYIIWPETTTDYTAHDLCGQFTTDTDTIYNCVDGKWRGHACFMPESLDNFDLVEGEVYGTFISEKVTITLT